MALKHNFTTHSGYTGDYIKISKVTLDKSKGTIDLSFYRNATARKTNKKVVPDVVRINTQYKFDYDFESNDNAIEQAYNYLKTLPEFEGAEDC